MPEFQIASQNFKNYPWIWGTTPKFEVLYPNLSYYPEIWGNAPDSEVVFRNLRYYPEICLQGLKQAIKSLRKDIRYRGREMNLQSPERNEGAQRSWIPPDARRRTQLDDSKQMMRIK
jgi:hypothetical protein